MNLKTKLKIKTYRPLKRLVCELLDSDYESLEKEVIVGIAMLAVVFRENHVGIVEASNIMPYLEDNHLPTEGKTVKHCLDVIEKYQLVSKDGKLDIGDIESPVSWGLAANLFSGHLERSWSAAKKEWMFKMTEDGLSMVENMLKKDLPGKK